MICPYCAEDVPAHSQQHHGCRRHGDRPFPPLYLDHHAGEASPEPVVLSVVGFPGHGKTVFLCALFDYMDDPLPYLWRNNFHNLVLDQESLSLLNKNRRGLRRGELPEPTKMSFPRPGIFRLTHMPHTAGDNGLPPLEDTTILIYDPPGEAFETEEKIVEYASFVERSSCVLFLIDLTALGSPVAHGMAELLDTYVLGMRRMGIERQSQDLIVVFTKSDEIKVSVPEFAALLEREPWLKEYLEQRQPASLANPHEHFKKLERVSRLLADFTWSDLKAARFINVAADWFASTSFTAVSSLGEAPEFEEVRGEGGDAAEAAPLDDDAPHAGNGRPRMRLASEMSPRGVADPLLYVLAKSLKDPPPLPPEWWLKRWLKELPLWAILALIGGAGLLSLALFTLLASARDETAGGRVEPVTQTTAARATPTPVAAPEGMVYVPGGDFNMGSADGDDFERPAHKVSVKPFFIDRYEVTCADYARFVEQTGHAPPPGWAGRRYPPGWERRPVTGVTWDDAVAYASWAGRRLPTEAEWEFAARGTDGRRYTWGSEWRAGAANAGGTAGGGLVDVGTFKVVSPFGAYDMIGNAWEWTADDLHPYPGGQWQSIPQGMLKVVRGGSWQDGPEQATATYRGYLPARGGRDYSVTGFRCARDAAGQTVADAGSPRR
jgi:formylglycine-generating enzyme required for sulfatase activity